MSLIANTAERAQLPGTHLAMICHLRDSTLSTDSFRRQVKTRLFSEY